MATLATGISATDTLLVIAGDVSGVEKGLRFRLDDEICDLAGFDRHVTVAGKRPPGSDRNRWIVERHVGTSAPASHDAGTTVEAVVSASVSGDDLTLPIPFAGTGDGSGIPQGGPLTEPLDTGEQAIVSTDGIYLIADQSVIDLQRKDAGAVVRSELLMSSSEGRTDIHARDADGNLITTWEVGEDGFGVTVYDELLNARALHSAEAGASDDEDAFWEWTVKNTAGTDKAKLTLDETGFHLEAVNVILTGLPASDPAVVGALWNDTGTLKVSAG